MQSIDKHILFENVYVIRASHLVLKNISFSIKKGESVAIYGPNGAGKTTLLMLVNGLLSYYRGNIFVKNTLISPETAQNIRILTGYVPQNFDVDYRIPILTGTVVLSGCYGKLGLFKYPSHKEIQQAYQIMEKFEISHLFNRPFGQISGGERQKAMIARAMMLEPEILLLDEPFSSVSEASKEKIIEIIRNFQKEKGITILLVSHEKETIKKLCKRIFYIEQGEIISKEDIDGNL